MENFESKKIEIKENKDREETIKNKIIPKIFHFSAHNCTKKSVPTYVPNIKPKSSRIKDPIANNPIIIPNREYI